jgi:hypothetical protein
METKTVTLRLPQDVADYINSRSDYGMTDGVKNIVETLRRHERYADMELRGRFTPEEWKFLADSMNGTMMLDDFRFVPSALVAHNEDSQLYEGTADKWHVSLDELNRKCAALTATQVEALYRRIERFWNTQNGTGIDLDQWAQY